MEPAELIKIKKEFGAKVAAAIAEHQYTLYFIQKNTGIKIANIQAVIRGDKNYTIDTLVTLCKFLHLSKIF